MNKLTPARLEAVLADLERTHGQRLSREAREILGFFADHQGIVQAGPIFMSDGRETWGMTHRGHES